MGERHLRADADGESRHPYAARRRQDRKPSRCGVRAGNVDEVGGHEVKQPEDRRPKEPTLAEAAAQLDRRRQAQINRQIEIIDRLLTGDGYDEILRSQTEEIAKLRV